MGSSILKLSERVPVRLGQEASGPQLPRLPTFMEVAAAHQEASLEIGHLHVRLCLLLIQSGTDDAPRSIERSGLEVREYRGY
jgi:hypothetical protein